MAPALREALKRGRFTAGGLQVALGAEPDGSPGTAPVFDRMLAQDDRGLLARLFLLGLEVDAELAEPALAPADVDNLVSAGFLERRGGNLTCPIRITPFEGLLLAHDPEPISDPDPAIVTGLNSAARTLASLTPRRQAGRALDIGTGSGVQALLAATHCDSVVATDVNERALEFTRLGAALSDLDNVETRAGSFFDPVEGEEFDLIACNPPYVISPDSELVYRDGGLEGDEVSRIAVRGAADHLAANGLAVVLCNWVRAPFQPWAEPLRDWLSGSGCDALLLHHVTEEPLEYAAKWNTRHRARPGEHGEVLDRWVDYYRDREITALSTGGVALRRRDRDEPLVTEMEMAAGPSGRGGEHVVRLLDAAELLERLDDDQLLATSLTLVEDHALQREREHHRTGYGEETVRVALSDSAGLRPEFGPAVAALLMGLGSGSPPAELVPKLAGALGASEEEARGAVAGAIRALVAQGIVEPAEALDSS
jgi:methylase of polypeptide subunit release factors